MVFRGQRSVDLDASMLKLLVSLSTRRAPLCFAMSLVGQSVLRSSRMISRKKVAELSAMIQALQHTSYNIDSRQLQRRTPGILLLLPPPLPFLLMGETWQDCQRLPENTQRQIFWLANMRKLRKKGCLPVRHSVAAAEQRGKAVQLAEDCGRNSQNKGLLGKARQPQSLLRTSQT